VSEAGRAVTTGHIGGLFMTNRRPAAARSHRAAGRAATGVPVRPGARRPLRAYGARTPEPVN